MAQEDKAFTFRIPVELLETLHELAAAQDLSVAQVIRRELKRFVAESKEKYCGV